MILASGINFSNLSFKSSISSTLLYKIYICPSLDNSLYTTSLINLSSSAAIYVCIAFLFLGGVSIIDKLFIPNIASCNVLGIGVAVSVRTSIFDLYSFIFSLCATPNLCSSSITKRPKSLASILSFNILWVPNNISIFPSLNSFIILLTFFCETNLFNNAILTG